MMRSSLPLHRTRTPGTGQRADRCPECGTPIDEIPLVRCRYHAAAHADEEEALRREREARPIEQKIRESEDFDELRETLAVWVENLEGS